MTDIEDPRDLKGRFSKGRKPKATRADYLEAMARVCTPEKWAEIVQRAVEDAVNGDATARLWLSRHLLGRPDSVNLLAVLAPPEPDAQPPVTEPKRGGISSETLAMIRKEVFGIVYDDPPEPFDPPDPNPAVPVSAELLPKDHPNPHPERDVTARPPPATATDYKRAIHARCRELGVSDRERKAYQRARFGKESLADFTDEELAAMWDHVSGPSPSFKVTDDGVPDSGFPIPRRQRKDN